MQTRISNPQENMQSGHQPQSMQMVDARDTLTAQRRAQHMANTSEAARQLGRVQARMQAKSSVMQRVEEEAPMQAMPETVQRVESAKPNNTGLPDQLKSGIESLSGMSMDHVKVHYNSSKPAQLNAHAYAQGNEIHVAPGQEQHLPHEAWHVVQQAQGRVKPTMQMKAGVPVNDDATLEDEADAMGAKALELGSRDKEHAVQNKTIAQLQTVSANVVSPAVQRYASSEEGFQISENATIVLKQDHSKELYATEAMLGTAREALAAKQVTNVELTAAGDWHFGGRDYKKISPKFKNYAGTKLTSKSTVQNELGDANNRLYGKFALGWMHTMNFLSSCSANPWYKDSLKNHKTALSDKGRAEAALGAIGNIQKKMQDAVVLLRDIHTDIDQDAEKAGIKLKVTGNMGKLAAIGWDTLEKLIIYTSGDEIAKATMLKQVAERVQQLDNDIAAIDQDSPYLPTSCGDLKNYLLANSNAIENGGNVGDYHYIDYSDDDTANGPWENHYASIIMKDGGDTVALEDAAGQAEPNEKSHWYYMMYGTQEAQSFEEKTNAEYHRRAQQRTNARENS